MVTLQFFDSSALVKRYVNEAGSTWVKKAVAPATNNNIVVAHITWVEMLSALSRLKREGKLDNSALQQAIRALQFDFDIQYQIVALDQTVIQTAGQLVQRHVLRSFDAVQLAAALVLKHAFDEAQAPSPVFVSADQRLLNAATAEGLVVINPLSFP